MLFSFLGNVNGRFRMVGQSLFHNTFSYRPDGIYDPLVFVLLVEVTDGHFSTTVTVVVNVIPWATTVSTTTITTTVSSHMYCGRRLFLPFASLELSHIFGICPTDYLPSL